MLRPGTPSRCYTSSMTSETQAIRPVITLTEAIGLAHILDAARYAGLTQEEQILAQAWANRLRENVEVAQARARIRGMSDTGK